MSLPGFRLWPLLKSLKSGVLFSLGIFAMVCGLMSGPAIADTECPTHIWIESGKQTREKNGAITQHYYIRNNIRNSGDAYRDCSRNNAYQAFYRFQSSSKKHPYRFDRSFPKADYYRAHITCDQGKRYMDITSESNARIELHVYGTCGRIKLSAQIVHPLFGKARSGEGGTQGPIGQLPEDFPRLSLHASPRNFYMQTGQTYQFDYAGKGPTINTLSILENHEHLADVTRSPSGLFAYTPPHDPKLDRTGPYDVKQTVTLVQESTPEWDYATSQTLLLHRAYRTHLRLLPGLVLFGATLAVFAGIVGYARNKRRP